MNDDANKTVKESQAVPISSTTPGAGDDLLRAGIMQQPDQPGMLGKIGRFDIIKVLGQGGMGEVLLAREPATNVRVAIKVLKPQLAKDPASVHRFLTEARHAYAMSHPNILKVLEVSESEDRPFYVMPYLEGGSLAWRIGPQKSLPTATITDFARQVAQALNYAHSRGIIHRDLKPANVLVDAEGHAYLTDFGLLRTVFNDSFVDVQQSALEGTAPYMSPAVVEGKAEDTRCDIYSFGAMLYEMLTGQPPYLAPSVDIILKKIAAGPPEPILKINPKAARPLAAIADWAMARELRDRYATMADVLADLERVAKGNEPLGPRGTVGLSRQTRRNLAIAGAALLVVILGIALWQTGQKHGGFGSQSLPPSLDLVKDFGTSKFVYEAYRDERLSKAGDAMPFVRPLHSVGMWKDGNTPEYYYGPAFFPAGGSLPYVAQNTNLGHLLMHPAHGHGATVGVSIETTAIYELSGAFARYCPNRTCGDGVDVAVFRNSDTTNLLFSQHITPDHEVKYDSPFEGTGVTSFRLKLPLSEGDVVRFAVFSGRRSHVECDGTALRATITPLSPLPQPTKPTQFPSAARQPQNLIVNGSFEQPEVHGTNRPLSSGSKELIGWFVGSTGNVEIIRETWPASDGFNSLDMSGLQSGSISQDVFLNKGTAYVLSFDMAYNRVLTKPASLKVSIGGYSKDFSRDPAEGAPFWRHQTLPFVATNTGPTKLTFQDATVGGGWSGSALDNVNLIAVSSNEVQKLSAGATLVVPPAPTTVAPPASGTPPTPPGRPMPGIPQRAVRPPVMPIPAPTTAAIPTASAVPVRPTAESPEARLAKMQAMFKGKVTLRPDGRFEFFYDFSDPAQLDDWVFREPTAVWVVEDGWLVCKKNASRDRSDTRLHHKALFAGKERELSYDAQSPDGLGAGLFAEIENASVGHFYHLPEHGGRASAGAGRDIATTNFGALDPKHVYHLDVAGKPDSFSIAVDGKVILQGPISPSNVQTGTMAFVKLTSSLGRYDNIRIIGALDPDQYQFMFYEYFEYGLNQWTGKNDGRHSGIVVPDPLSSGRGSVLSFTNLAGGGDVFTRQAFANPADIEISFDYLGLAKPGSVAGDLGGFFGLSWSLMGDMTSFYAGTQDGYGSIRVPLIDDGKWHEARYVFRGGTEAAFHLTIEDFMDSKGVAGDVYFDNIRVKAVRSRRTASVLAGPIVNPSNGHNYFLLTPDTWRNSEELAVELGGHLVTINDQAEQDWVFSLFGSFGGTNRSLWIGLREVGPEGNYQWVSAERLSYTNWFRDQPSATEVAAEFVHMMNTGNEFGPPAGKWNDLQGGNMFFPTFDPVCGVVEVVPPAKPTGSPPAVPRPGAKADWRSVLQQADAAYAENRYDEAIKLYDTALAGLEQDQTTDATILKTMKAGAQKHRGLATFIPQRDKLPADKQIEALHTKLRELNPNYSGKGQFIIRDGKIVEAWLFRSETPDLSPLKGLSLTRLNCAATGTQDLAPLRGMPLQELDCGWNQVSDLTPLKGMRLTSLDFEHESGGVTDLAPLKGMALKRLNARHNVIKDLSPLQGMPLEWLSVRAPRKGVITDLSPLRGMPLNYLDICNNPVSDLSPLRKCPLNYLDAGLTEVSDLSPLAGMPITFLPIVGPKITDLTVVKDLPRLEKLVFKAGDIKAGWEAIRRHPNLKIIEPFGDWGSSRPAAEFWKRFDAGEFTNAPPPAPKPAVAVPKPTSTNLLANGNFELESAPGKSDQWHTFDWREGKTDIKFELSSEAHSGKRSAAISSKTGGDGCWFQTIAVEPYRNYRFAGWVKTQGIESKGGNGVNFDTAPGQGHIGVRFGREILRGTNDWHKFETVFNALHYNELLLAGVFGGRGPIAGQAWFDDLSLVPMKEIPRAIGQVFNGSFEEAEDGWPSGWSVRTWSDWSPKFEYAKTGHSGSCSVKISAQPGRSGVWTFMARVKPNTTYRLSGWIRTENLSGGALANLAIGVHGYFWGTGNDQPFASDGTGGTQGWTKTAVTFPTGRHEWIQVVCQLVGGDDSASGDAWFDDIELNEVR